MMKFDEQDQILLARRQIARDQHDRPRLGDYVRFPTGELERIAADLGNGMQTAPVWAGAYFLFSNGNASFSGSLNPPVDPAMLTLTGDSIDGAFWFFHHDEVGAGRRVNASLPCRVYATTQPYRGFVTRGI